MLSQLHHGYFESGAVVSQSEYARNLINGNGLKINKEYVRRVKEMQSEKSELVDYQSVPGPDEENLTGRLIQDTPGYAFLLAATWKIFGEQRYIYVQVIQVLIDTFMIFLVFRIGSEFFNRQIGFLAGSFYALYLPQVRLAVAASRDTWATFAVIICLYLLSRMIKNPDHSRRWIYYALVGLAIGLSTWLRPTVAFVPIFIGIAIFFRDGIKECLAAIMVSMFVVCITFWLPFIMMNYRDFGRPFIGPFGQGLWAGMGIAGENKYGFTLSDRKAAEWAKNQGCDYEYGTPEFDDFLKKYAVNVIKRDPLFYLGTIARRLPSVILLRNDYGLPNVNYSDFRKETGGTLKKFIRKYPFQFFYKSFRGVGEGLLAIIALIGFWISREKWRQNLLLAIFPIYFIIVHVPIHVESRYILPGAFSYLIFAAVLVYAVYEKTKLRKSSS
ncbi:ArnT family glycosyltransferase [Candidatus Poribacteria bacterium]